MTQDFYGAQCNLSGLSFNLLGIYREFRYNLFGSLAPITEHSYVELSLFRMFAYSEVAKDFISDLMGGSWGPSFSFLGGCYQCDYCQCMIPPGTYECYRCGASQSRYIAQSKSYEVGRVSHSECCMIEDCGDDARFMLEIRAFCGDGALTAIKNSKRLDLLSTMHAPGWLCRYCHSIVEERYSDCQFCGGGRMPFSDIAKMNPVCLYCGSETDNGVCRGCFSMRGATPKWPAHYVM